MNELKTIDERTVLGQDFRIYGDFDIPLFLAKDVAKWIGHSDVSTMVRTVDENEKVTNIVCTPGGKQSATFLTEDGLYEVLMQSRKPIAKAFKKEVKQILKTIRRHGMYATEELLENPDIAIAAFTALKEEREKNKALQAENSEMQPKALFADAVSTSSTSILIGELAKILTQNGYPIGQNRLFKKLRAEGYLIGAKNRSDYNMPTQRYMNSKLFEIKETAITRSDGHITINRTVKVTGKGQIYFVNKFLGMKVGVEDVING